MGALFEALAELKVFMALSELIAIFTILLLLFELRGTLLLTDDTGGKKFVIVSVQKEYHMKNYSSCGPPYGSRWTQIILSVSSIR